MDETGFARSTYRTHGWATRGKRVFGFCDALTRPRTSLIGAYCRGQTALIAPLLFEGTCNTQVFNLWLTHEFLPQVPRGCYLVLDNAAFHRAASSMALLKQAGVIPLFLPPYSPELNPIEKCWANIKRAWRNALNMTLDQVVAVFGYIEE
jgi:hypothetical protein